jgi:hypothetical protein
MKMPNRDIIVELIDALAETDGLEPTELDYNLSDHMDPEVLERLCAVEDGVWELAFVVSDHHVKITHERDIFIDGVKRSADSLKLE